MWHARCMRHCACFMIQRSAAATWFLRVTRGWDEQRTRQRSAVTQHVRDGIYDVTATSGREQSASARIGVSNNIPYMPICVAIFLANVNLVCHILICRYVIPRPSVCCLSSVWTFVRPTQAIEIFGNVSSPFGTLAICWHPGKMLQRSSQGNPSVGAVKHKKSSRL